MKKGYVVYTIIKTDARHSIDGKAHRTTNYYTGSETLLGCNMTNWKRGCRNAKVFESKKEANYIAKRYGGKVKEIQEVAL